jgi:hypothetical protein
MTALLGSGTSTQEDTRLWTNDGDHEREAHYAPKEEVMEALVNGTPVTALCGKKWVPFRNPDNYPVCKTCTEIYEGLQNE